MRVSRAHTAELAVGDLAAARALLDRAFDDLPPEERFGDDDWATSGDPPARRPCSSRHVRS